MFRFVRLWVDFPTYVTYQIHIGPPLTLVSRNMASMVDSRQWRETQWKRWILARWVWRAWGLDAACHVSRQLVRRFSLFHDNQLRNSQGLWNDNCTQNSSPFSRNSAGNNYEASYRTLLQPTSLIIIQSDYVVPDIDRYRCYDKQVGISVTISSINANVSRYLDSARIWN